MKHPWRGSPKGWIQPEIQREPRAVREHREELDELEIALRDYESAIASRDPAGGEHMSPSLAGGEWRARCPRWRICGSTHDSLSIAVWEGRVRYYCRRCGQLDLPPIGDHIRDRYRIEEARREADHLPNDEARIRILEARPFRRSSPLEIHPGRLSLIADPDPGGILLASPGGSPLIVRDAINLWWGAPGRGKSWAAMWACDEVLKSSSVRWVIWCSWEQPPPIVRSRAFAIGIKESAQLAILDHPDMAEVASLVRRTPGRVLVVLDSVEASGCPADTGSIHAWKEAHVDPVMEAGASMLLIDHIAKGQQDSPYPRGSMAKMAMVQGAGIRLVSGSRMWTRMTSGHVILRLEKDNTGAELGNIATLQGYPSRDGRLRLTMSEGEVDGREIAKRILTEILWKEPGLGRRKAAKVLAERGAPALHGNVLQDILEEIRKTLPPDIQEDIQD